MGELCRIVRHLESRIVSEPQRTEAAKSLESSVNALACVHCGAVHITLSLPCGERKSTIRRVNYWNIIADTLDSLNMIPTDEQSGLQTHIATTESVSMCERMKS